MVMDDDNYDLNGFPDPDVDNTGVDIGDPDEEALAPLDSSSIEVSGSGRGGGSDPGSQYAYSAIIQRETGVGFGAMYDWVRQNRPDEKYARNLIAGLVDLARMEWQSPACLRKMRFEEEEVKANYWLSRMGKDQAEEKENAELLLKIWGSANLVQIEIRHRRLREGLDMVDQGGLDGYRDRCRWYTAIKKKEIVEQQASNLNTMAYEYFRCRLEQYNIQREEAEDRAQQNPSLDYSNLLKRISLGQARSAEIVSGCPWSMNIAIFLALQNPGEKNPYWDHIERLMGGVARAVQHRSRRARRGGDAGGGDQGSGPVM